MKRYAQVVFMRAGLANMLAPWVRAFVWATEHDASMLAPRWFKFRLGPYLRGERDKRQYHRLFTNAGYVAGLERAWILSAMQTMEESALPPTGNPGYALVVRFRGLDGFIWPAVGRSRDVLAELRRITVPVLRPDEPREPFIAIHVRMGDFGHPDEAALRAGAWNVRQPIEWYVAAARALRHALGAEVPLRVFADGAYAGLLPLLSLPETHLVTDTTAITDLLDLTQASALVASGSTFSIMASFLGQVPTVWFPGQFRGSVADERGFTNEIEWASTDQVPESFSSAVQKRLYR